MKKSKSFITMKKLSYLLILFLSVAVASCGNKKESTESENYDWANDSVCEVAVDEVEESGAEASSSADNSKIDKFLDDYEAMVDEYDNYVSKLKSGSVDMQSVMNIAAKAESMQDNLEGMESEMTTAQRQRLTKLVSKLTSIAAKASNINVDDIQSAAGVNLKDLGL